MGEEEQQVKSEKEKERETRPTEEEQAEQLRSLLGKDYITKMETPPFGKRKKS